MPSKSLLFLSLLLCSSCAQLSLFQDAKTLGKGKASIGGHVSGYGITGEEDIILPSLVAYGSYGVIERMDLQFSVSLAGSFALSPKFQILGDKSSKWAFSLNPGLALHVGGLNDDDIGVVRTHYSTIGSYHPNDKVSLFMEPRYITQYRNDQENDHFYGSTLGVCLKTSKAIDFSVGASFFDVTTSSDLLYQLGIGINYRLSKDK